MWPGRDSEPKMHTLYECHGKSGTTGSTVLWFFGGTENRRGYLWN